MNLLMNSPVDEDLAALEATLDALTGSIRPVPAAGAQAEPLAELAAAQALHDRLGLNERALLDSARNGATLQTAARLAVAANVPFASVERAIATRSAKALVSLVWAAGFSMHAALSVQAVLAELAPDQMLCARPGGAFPLTPEAMRFQLELLARSS